MRKIINFIDQILNGITMYRVVLYYLIVVLTGAGVESYFGILPFQPLSLVVSAAILVGVSWVGNTIFARTFGAQTNNESVYITALILALIITPVAPTDLRSVSFLVWAALWASASKYIFAIGNKHIFNPVAVAMVTTSFVLGRSASWWVGGTVMLMPLIIAGGLLVVRKIRRADLVMSFFVAVIATMLFTGTGMDSLWTGILHAPIFFFAFVMITEPLTTPPTRTLRIPYGILMGVLFVSKVHFGSIYSTPELALMMGNLFSYLVSPKGKYLLRLVGVEKVGTNTYDFIFEGKRPIVFRPGQYMEWTLAHPKADSRGNRRYFTLASSPREKNPRIGVKFYSAASSFKKALAAMKEGDEVVAGQVGGDFVFPRNTKEKLVCIAGGIGATPFRSMVQDMIDRGEPRSIEFLYSNKTVDEIAYRNVFDAARHLGVRTVYTLTDQQKIPPGWDGAVGTITPKFILQEVPDYRERTFYISGPHAMVSGVEAALRSLGVKKSRIKIDFFPGFA
ncbi:MAG: RnfABCDGE type electron transport complex subunit D [Minisyncoccota bacterium]